MIKLHHTRSNLNDPVRNRTPRSAGNEGKTSFFNWFPIWRLSVYPLPDGERWCLKSKHFIPNRSVQWNKNKVKS